MTRANEIFWLLAIPVSLVVCGVFQFDQSGAVVAMTAAVGLLAIFIGYDRSNPAIRQLMPVVVLTALAVAGRIVFAPFPDVKPVTAIVILSGFVFGRRCGFMTGALAALLSNFFFGQGMWTPWQMYAWGLVGYLAGTPLLGRLFDHRAVVLAYGFVSCLLFGLIMNSFYLVGYVHPITWQSALLAYGAGLPLDLVHGVATVAFLAVIWVPWASRLEHAKRKYELDLESV